VALDLVALMGNPIIASSVHDEDEMLGYTADPLIIHENIGHTVDMVIDSGPSGLQASTVLSCLHGKISLVREGKGFDAVVPWLQ
jgi:tRNA A37 threonylcarbamoyladenosine synthetase subunit TsaC/SUA5/YrdC